MVTVASGDKYPRACRCHRGSPRRHECAPALRRLQVLALAPPQASERQDRRIHELGSLSFFSLPDCGEADSILSLRFSGSSAKQIDTWQKTAGGLLLSARREQPGRRATEQRYERRRFTAQCLPCFRGTPRHGRLLHPSSWAERDDRDHAAENFCQGGSPKTGHPISPPGPPHRQKSSLTKFPGMRPG